MTAEPSAAPSTPVEVRERLVEALKLDLVGPWAGHALAEERLPRLGAPVELVPDRLPDPVGHAAREERRRRRGRRLRARSRSRRASPRRATEERKAAKKGFFPSSMGLSFLVPTEARALTVTVRWGDYAHGGDRGRETASRCPSGSGTPREATVDGAARRARRRSRRARRARTPAASSSTSSSGRSPREDLEGHIPPGTRSVSVFLVNHRAPPDEERARPRLRLPARARGAQRRSRSCRGRTCAARGPTDWDEQVADLHYADTPEYATGHGVSADWEIVDGACRVLRTRWIPSAEVEKTGPWTIAGRRALDGGARRARRWRRGRGGAAAARRRSTATGSRRSEPGIASLARRAARDGRGAAALRRLAADRIERGIDVLADGRGRARRLPRRQPRRRAGAAASGSASTTPRWRAFQLAFILLNLPGLADPRDPTARRWTCSSSRPAAARPRPTSASRPSRWCCAGCATRARTGSRAPA